MLPDCGMSVQRDIVLWGMHDATRILFLDNRVLNVTKYCAACRKYAIVHRAASRILLFLCK